MKTPAFLGIGGWHHDAAAAVVSGGRIVAAAEEERFTRSKHQRGVPRRAIEFCLKAAGARMEDLAGVGVFFRPHDAVFGAFELAPRRLKRRGPFGLAHSAYDIWRAFALYREIQEACLRGPAPGFFRHHETHAAAAFRLSCFEKAAILSVDEVGESQSTWWGRGEAGALEQLGEVRYPHSLGKLYSAVSQHLGFEELEEFRVMGLAAYGTPAVVGRFRRAIRLTPDGFELDLDWFNFPHRPTAEGMTNERFAREFGPPRRPEEEIGPRHKDLAFAVQAVIEEAMLHLARIVRRKTGEDRLCLTGGVALNCVANGRLVREGPFKNVFVPFAAGDAGCAVGAAFLAEAHARGTPAPPVPDLGRVAQTRVGCRPDATRLRWSAVFGRPLVKQYAASENGVEARPASKPGGILPDQRAGFGSDAGQCNAPLAHPFLGPAFSDSEIEEALKKSGIAFTRPHDILRTIAGELAAGGIVARFAGEMEFGPRALGHRSILADPRRAENADRLNRAVKWREPFRPFAPSVPEERAPEHFEGTPSPYMAIVLNVRPESRDLLPAITHRDGTARVQAVRKDWDADFHRLHIEFEKLAGVPVLLNTSFNVKGEPIVCTPADAIATYLKTGLDAMAIGPFWLNKAPG